MEPHRKFDLVILMPVYNDWETARILIERIDRLFFPDTRIRIIMVDDGSIDSYTDSINFGGCKFSIISELTVLILNRNLSHQRAIAIGLSYIKQKYECSAVLVMDSDGEDKPEDIPLLVKTFRDSNGRRAIFAKRERRQEGFIFQIFYRLYLFLNLVLIGRIFKVGNFSIIPFDSLSALVVSSELWNHYAATVFKLRLPVELIPISRGTRLLGKSKMNFVSLIVHGLSAISVFTEVVGTRVLIACFSFTLVLLLAVGGLFLTMGGDVFGSRSFMFGLGLSVSLILNGVITITIFLLSTLGDRNLSTFLPIRDFHYFIKKVASVYG